MQKKVYDRLKKKAAKRIKIAKEILIVPALLSPCETSDMDKQVGIRNHRDQDERRKRVPNHRCNISPLDRETGYLAIKSAPRNFRRSKVFS